MAVHEAYYHAPPDMRAPHRWALSINGIPMRDHPTPTSRGWWEEVIRHY